MSNSVKILKREEFFPEAELFVFVRIQWQHCWPMRPKATELGQHLGQLEESDLAGYDFVRDWWPMPPAMSNHTACPVMYTKHHHELRHARKAWPGAQVDLCLLFAMLLSIIQNIAVYAVYGRISYTSRRVGLQRRQKTIMKEYVDALILVCLYMYSFLMLPLIM